VTVPTKLLYWADPKLRDSKVGSFAERNLEGNIASQESMSQFLFQSAIPNSVIRNLLELPIGYAFGGAGQHGETLSFMDNAYIQAELEALRYQVSSESEKYWKLLNRSDTVDQNGKPLVRSRKGRRLLPVASSALLCQHQDWRIIRANAS
jgi:hypothetical protein